MYSSLTMFFYFLEKTFIRVQSKSNTNQDDSDTETFVLGKKKKRTTTVASVSVLKVEKEMTFTKLASNNKQWTFRRMAFDRYVTELRRHTHRIQLCSWVTVSRSGSRHCFTNRFVLKSWGWQMTQNIWCKSHKHNGSFMVALHGNSTFFSTVFFTL